MWNERTEPANGGGGGRGEAAVAAASNNSSSRQHQYFIDGPGRLTSALQLISSAIGASAAGGGGNPTPHPAHSASASAAIALSADVSRSPSEERCYDDDVDDASNENSFDVSTVQRYNGSDITSSRTIIASDSEVSNGFVKDGKRLPYVFEATESGARKRSSKILPVCGVCGKRFVCVTTMKRHLVTHTGEKPFSCKVCGKQYTQKGNLRVHERTHRNDRPFECNICHQKFYRKEPMQKHQWRQHGIVHFKQRPHPAGINTTGPPTTPLTKNTQIDGGGPASAVLYNSIVDRIKYNSLETMGESSRHLGGSPTEAMAPPPPPPPPPSHQMSQPQSPQSGPEDLSNPRSTLNSTDNEDDVSVPKPIGSTTDRSPPPAPSSRPTPAAEEEEEGEEEKEEEEEEEPAHDHNDEFKHAKHNFEARPTYEAADEASSSTFALSSSVARHLHSHRAAPLLDSTSPSSSSRSPSPQPQNHTRLLIALQPTPTSLPPLHPNEEEDDHRPIKLKKLLAHAYQKEVEEAEEQTRHQNQHSINTVTTTPHQQHLADENSSSSSEESCSGGSNKSSSAAPLGYNGEMQETVECQCKSCGHVFSVLDPYNFRCSSCNVKYTSLPTHMIADPLQCIGCCQVFPHKPALKSHQTRAAAGEGSCSERPFRCCKCGYGFRQKAHLQKHQWRIHRRKLEADPNVKEAEALLHVIKGGFSSSQAAPSAAAAVPKPPSLLDDGVATITLQDIIDRGVERSMRTVRQLPPPPSPPPQQPRPTSSSTNGSSQPLDLSPTKSINSNHHHHHHHPKLSDLVASMPRITVPPSISLLSNSLPLPRESNPLLNQLPLQLPTQPLRLNEAASSSSSPSGGWSKRQRTLLPSASSESDERHSSSNIIMHRSLPPITSLQRPPTETPSSYTKTSNWLAASTAMPPPPMTRHDDDNDMTSARRPADMVKKDLFIRDQLQGLRGRQHNDIRTV